MATDQAIWFGVNDGEFGPNGGLIVKDLDKFGSVSKAGIKVGDELCFFEGARFTTREDLYDMAEKIGIGGVLRVRLIRDGKKLEIPMKLRGKPKLTLSLDEVADVLERKIAP